MEKKMVIEGMKCNHCKMNVEKALCAVDGVREAAVDLEKKTAVIQLDTPVEDSVLMDAVREKGFDPQQMI